MSVIRWRGGLLTGVLLVPGIMGCDEDPIAMTVEISPSSATFSHAGEARGFAAVVRDQHGAVMDVPASWSSSDLSVFTVTESGDSATVTAVDNGTAVLTAQSGQATATAQVTIKRTPFSLEIVSGDNQEGPRGEPLEEPLIVRVADRGGKGVVGWPVIFTPGERSGSVSDSSVNTDEEGLASTIWSLDRRIQRQTVAVEVGDFETDDLDTTFLATAIADPPIPDYAIVGYLDPGRKDPTDADTIEITSMITNLSSGAVEFPVQVTVDGEPLTTSRHAPIEFGDTVAVTFLAIGVESGIRRIGIVINPDGEIDEWDEANNSASIELNVSHLGEFTLGDTITVKSDLLNEVRLYRVRIDEHSDDVLNVQTLGDDGVNLAADFHVRSTSVFGYRCLHWNSLVDKRCQFSMNKGSYYIALYTWSPYETRLTVTAEAAPEDPFDIDLVFEDHGTGSQDSIIKVAAGRWESLVGPGPETWPTHDMPRGGCSVPGGRFPGHSGPVDDVRMYIFIDSIDGPGESVAAAWPCARRWVTWLVPPDFTRYEWLSAPKYAIVILDSADISELESDELLEPVVMHQMAHSMGYMRNYWIWQEIAAEDTLYLLGNPSLPTHYEPHDPDNDAHFRGPLARTFFDAAGGVGYPNEKVPVESGGKWGISDNHWRESVFGHELMTPYLTGDTHPISEITLAALYHTSLETKLIRADPFTLTGAGVARMEMPRGPVVYLGDDGAALTIPFGRMPASFPLRRTVRLPPGEGSRIRE